jgi:predicted dinucleotide-binding enzyme
VKPTRIGILGSGLMGSKLGTIFARAGHEVVFSYSRSEQKLKKLARDAKGNAHAGTPAEAARDADVLLLAVHWSRVDTCCSRRAMYRARSSSPARCR